MLTTKCSVLHLQPENHADARENCHAQTSAKQRTGRREATNPYSQTTRGFLRHPNCLRAWDRLEENLNMSISAINNATVYNNLIPSLMNHARELVGCTGSAIKGSCIRLV